MMPDRTILYIAPQIPYPLTAGMVIRQYHLLASYARVGRVRLVAFYRHQSELAAVDALKPLCASCHLVPADTMYGEAERANRPRWRRRVEEAVTLKPRGAQLEFSREMQRVVSEIAPDADILHVARLQMVPYIAALTRKKSPAQRFVLDIDDIETVRKRRMLQSFLIESQQRRALEYYDFCKLWLYQRRALRWFDRVFVCSARDREYVGNGKAVVIPNGATVPPAVLPDESDGRTLLYVGTRSYWPNVDGLLYFLRQIFPLIRLEVPHARLLIVGKDPPPDIAALHDGKTVCVEGNVPSVEKYYRQATVSIVPLRVGGGTRLKILEAFAVGRPVISTGVGSEGLDVVNGEHLLVGDDPVSFARSCITLLNDPSLRSSLVARGRDLVEQRYTWESVEGRVERMAHDLLGEPHVSRMQAHEGNG